MFSKLFCCCCDRFKKAEIASQASWSPAQANIIINYRNDHICEVPYSIPLSTTSNLNATNATNATNTLTEGVISNKNFKPQKPRGKEMALQKIRDLQTEAEEYEMKQAAVANYLENNKKCLKYCGRPEIERHLEDVEEEPEFISQSSDEEMNYENYENYEITEEKSLPLTPKLHARHIRNLSIADNNFLDVDPMPVEKKKQQQQQPQQQQQHHYNYIQQNVTVADAATETVFENEELQQNVDIPCTQYVEDVQHRPISIQSYKRLTDTSLEEFEIDPDILKDDILYQEMFKCLQEAERVSKNLE